MFKPFENQQLHRLGPHVARPLGALFSVVLLVLALSLSGCKTLGNRVEQTQLPEGAPAVEDVLRDLAQNDALLQTLEARGRFIVISPNLGEGKMACNARIQYRRPTDLNIIGTHQLGFLVFRMISVGEEFYLEFPTEDKCFYLVKGLRIESVQFSVSPSDVAKEMFLAESWADLNPREFHLESYDPATGIARATVGSRKNPRRRLELQGPPWRVLRSERLDRSGEVVSETTLSDYYEKDGIRFPTVVDCHFISEDSTMKFMVKDPTMNPDLAPEIFTIDPKVAIECSSTLN